VAAPEYVPSSLAQQPRRGLQLPPARPSRNDRPGALGPAQPTGPGLGVPGPDQGYGIVLARRLIDRLHLQGNEHEADVLAGCVGVGLKRAALFGRAPVVFDFEIAFTLWGFLDPQPSAELLEVRRRAFQAAAHHYDHQRAIVDAVPEASLRLTPSEVEERHRSDWRSLLDLAGLEH
jgi:hypothetical protein